MLLSACAKRSASLVDSCKEADDRSSACARASSFWNLEKSVGETWLIFLGVFEKSNNTQLLTYLFVSDRLETGQEFLVALFKNGFNFLHNFRIFENRVRE